MNHSSAFPSLFKQPAAWLPFAMSLAALMLVVGYAAVFGIVHHADEGAPARLFQLLMLAQLPVVTWFAVRWLPRRGAQALIVLALQAVAWLIPILTVLWLESL